LSPIAVVGRRDCGTDRCRKQHSHCRIVDGDARQQDVSPAFSGLKRRQSHASTMHTTHQTAL